MKPWVPPHPGYTCEKPRCQDKLIINKTVDINLSYLCLAVAGVTLTTGCSTPRAGSHDELVSLLRQEMCSTTGWVRVHAAEALLDHHQAQLAAPVFAPWVDTTPPPLRIGVWRVMARAAETPAERERICGQIRQVMLDPQAPDRLHAAETMAKLGVSNPEDRPAIEAWLACAEPAIQPFLRWLLVLSGDQHERDREEMRISELLSASDPAARLRAAFALSRLPAVSADTLRRLESRLPAEPADSPAQVFLAVAVLNQFPEEAAAAAQARSRLTATLAVGKPGEQLEAAIALGKKHVRSSACALRQLLSSSEPDARIGAASGLLFLGL